MLIRGSYAALSEDRATLLRTAPFTYPSIGATRGSASLPRGFLPLRGSRVVGSGQQRFDVAAEGVLTWALQRGAGICVRASSSSIAEGVVVEQRIGPVLAPCRVVYVVDEPERKGFAYGTLPGHPERGEELFLVERDPVTDEVRLTVSSVSRPAAPWLPMWPMLRLVQRTAVHLFLRAID